MAATDTERPGRLERTRANVLDEATRALVDDPQLSLGELAATIGIGRTTLHRLFPTREDLLLALADDALHRVEAAQAAVVFPARVPRRGDELLPIRHYVAAMVPLGSRLLFLVRSPEILEHPDLAPRIAALDGPVVAYVQRAQKAGRFDPALPAWWMVESLNALVFVAWEQVASGRLAINDAEPFITRTWSRGVVASSDVAS